MVRRPTSVALTIIAGLAVVAMIYVASPIGASPTFDPTLDIIAISDQAPGANADITLRTSLPAGHDIVAGYGLELDLNTWSFARDRDVDDDSVTAVGTMDVTLDLDGDCNAGGPGTPENYGPFNLRDADTGTGPNTDDAKWTGTIR